MSKSALFVALILIGTFFISIQSLPTVKAYGFLSGSPVLGAGETYQINFTDVPEGAIIEWSWSADGNVESHFTTPLGTDISWNVGGTTSNAYQSDGWEAYYGGTYNMSWTNNNWIFSATVNYVIVWFIPTASTLTTPLPGSTIHSRHSEINGTCDIWADQISISLDNHSFAQVQKDFDSWSGNITLANGTNTVYIKTTYESGYFTREYVREFIVVTGFDLDFQPLLNLTSPEQSHQAHFLNTTLIGICDDNASTISVSTNNFTFIEAQKQGPNWMSPIQLASGQNTIYVKAGYVRGDFAYTYSRTFDLLTGFGLDFTPSVDLTAPTVGSSITDLTPQLSGHCDENASWVTYSPNNVTFYTTEKQGANWISSTSSQLSPGSNTIYVKATYQRGDFWYNCTKAFSVSVDTTWVYQKDGSTNLGIGAIAGIIAIIAVAGVGGFMLYRRRKKP